MEQPDAAADLVGRTSARLMAAGIERRERLESLHLLAILDASANDAGRIRRPLDDLAAEFELSPAGVMRSLDHLETAGALQRDGGEVLLLGREPEGLGGLHLADFLDDVRSAFDEEPARPSAWRARVGAGLVAAAAVIGVLTLAPSQPTGVGQTAASAVGSNSTSAPNAETTTLAADAPVAPSTAEVPNLSSAEVPVTDVPVSEPTVVAVAACPDGRPRATFDGSVLRITNPTASDVSVTAFSVGGVITRATVSVPAGQTVQRDVGLTSPVPLPAAVDTWSWADPTIEGSCTSS